MKLDLIDTLYALSFALDKVEAALLGAPEGHGKHVAYLAVLMGKEAGLSGAELRDFICCCLLHNTALTEFIHQELSGDPAMQSLKPADIARLKRAKLDRDHCVAGERNIRLLPFRTDVKNIVLYHHENADGTGPLGLTAAETPLKAQLLHLAVAADRSLRFRPETMTESELSELRGWVKGNTGSLFSDEAAGLFLKAVTYGEIADMQDKGLLPRLREELPKELTDYSDEDIRSISGLFAKIADYKSEQTREHSRGVAEKAEIMARHYGFGAEKAIRFYFAGAMHDIGKLIIPSDILEKPGRLTYMEYEEVKHHADATYYILSQIKEIPDIVDWASNHHEKLNGGGYPQGLTAKELSFEDQLLACIDIYQALTEKRPYKDGISHETTISIMRDMAGQGEINESIINDIDAVMAARF